VNILIFGPNGSGKGTQGALVKEKYKLDHIESGAIFRKHIGGGTELGKKAKEYIDRGELVPDDVTIAMVRDRLQQPDTKNGALLDGFPRTPAQAEALGEMLSQLGAEVNGVPLISVPDEELVNRLSGRWTCRARGHVFHEKFNPPQKPGVCDFDQSELYQRDDDRAETVRTRISVYWNQTAPLIDYYRKCGKLVEIDGNQPIECVTRDLLAALQSE